jgi:hypothetical protein
MPWLQFFSHFCSGRRRFNPLPGRPSDNYPAKQAPSGLYFTPTCKRTTLNRINFHQRFPASFRKRHQGKKKTPPNRRVAQTSSFILCHKPPVQRHRKPLSYSTTHSLFRLYWVARNTSMGCPRIPHLSIHTRATKTLRRPQSAKRIAAVITPHNQKKARESGSRII